MNVATITESRLTAREKYAEYMRAVKDRHSAEYEALKNAYRELSRGKQVIDINAVTRTAGVDSHYRPKLAIVRADARLCWFQFRTPDHGPLPTFSMQDNFSFRHWGRKRIEFPASTFNVPFETRRQMHLRAVVPTIPPSLMPKGGLDKYRILWEAEWESLPVDPMLLKHLGKGLHVVLATWDLSPLERAVLSDRL